MLKDELSGRKLNKEHPLKVEKWVILAHYWLNSVKYQIAINGFWIQNIFWNISHWKAVNKYALNEKNSWHLPKFSETIIYRNLTPTVKGGEDGQSNNQKPNAEPFWA